MLRGEKTPLAGIGTYSSLNHPELIAAAPIYFQQRLHKLQFRGSNEGKPFFWSSSGPIHQGRAVGPLTPAGLVARPCGDGQPGDSGLSPPPADVLQPRLLLEVLSAFPITVTSECRFQ